MSGPRTQWRRNPLVAASLAVIGSPVVAMCYLGRGRRALVYLALVLACPVVSFMLAKAGAWPAGVHWSSLYLIVVALGVTDAVRIAHREPADFSGPWFSTWQGLVGIAVVYGVVSLSARSMLIEPFRVPAQSMAPTLVPGDHFFANKFAYGLRLPFSSIELTSGEMPARGDVIVFRPRNSDIRFVKRIIGVPGDIVAIDSATGEISINGEAVMLERLGPFDADPAYQLAQETIGSRSHELLLRPEPSGRGGTYAVPAGSYFVLGDSRANSLDSRSPEVGLVPEQNIIGKAWSVWWNTSEPGRAGMTL